MTGHPHRLLVVLLCMLLLLTASVQASAGEAQAPDTNPEGELLSEDGAPTAAMPEAWRRQRARLNTGAVMAGIGVTYQPLLVFTPIMRSYGHLAFAYQSMPLTGVGIPGEDKETGPWPLS